MFQAFLEFCYIAWRDVITEDHLTELQDALTQFHKYHNIFIETGVWSSFLLPCQHSMMHYHSLSCKFGSPNGLCTSITKSKHIRAIKEPWRRSNHSEALGQMLVTNQHLDQLAAAHTHFTNWGMLNRTCLAEVLQVLGKSKSWFKVSDLQAWCSNCYRWISWFLLRYTWTWWRCQRRNCWWS